MGDQARDFPQCGEQKISLRTYNGLLGKKGCAQDIPAEACPDAERTLPSELLPVIIRRAEPSDTSGARRERAGLIFLADLACRIDVVPNQSVYRAPEYR